MESDEAALVELVIPTFDRPKLLEEAVRSALEETPFRVTVLDDHSPVPVEQSLDTTRLNAEFAGRLRVIRNVTNLGASPNTLRALAVSRAPYTWAFTDDHVVQATTAREIVDAIRDHPDAAILFWHASLPDSERLDIESIGDFVELIERGSHLFGQSDVYFNRVVRTEVGLRYMRLDARFSHAQPMLGIQLAALVDGRHVHIRGGAIGTPQIDATSWWTTRTFSASSWIRPT